MQTSFCCKGKRLANYLLDHGCELFHIDCDRESKGFLVFFFVRDEHLNMALDSWQQDKDTYLI